MLLGVRFANQKHLRFQQLHTETQRNQIFTLWIDSANPFDKRQVVTRPGFMTVTVCDIEMAIEIVDFPIENGGSFQFVM